MSFKDSFDKYIKSKLPPDDSQALYDEFISIGVNRKGRLKESKIIAHADNLIKQWNDDSANIKNQLEKLRRK